MNISSKNKEYWNIVKGIGILSIVIGHTNKTLSSYVYLFHLVIFFFVSGYLYSEDKYGDDPFLNFMSRLKTNWKKYFAFSTIYVLLHNIFLEIGIIINTSKYSFIDIIMQLINSMLLQCYETLAGALWFVPVLILASTLFGIIIFLGRKMSKIFNKKWIKHVIIIFIGIFFSVIGVMMNMKNMGLFYHSQTSILVVPIFIIAYYVRHIKDINPFLKFYAFIPSIIFLYLCVNKFSWSIELSENNIPGYIFYLISIVGIYVCLYLAKILLRLKKIKKYFLLIGKYSFEIMALHFICLKLVDIVYAIIIGNFNPLVYGIFPTAYNEIWLIYVMVGTLLPCIIMTLYKRIIETLKIKLKLT